MKLVAKSVVSLVCGGCIVYALAHFTGESFEPVLYWSLPLFHEIYPPWVAGPNPEAVGCVLLTNTVLIAALTFLLLSFKKKKQTGS
jgi:hypothetical protein